MFWRLFGTSGVLLLSTIGLLGMVIVGRVEKHYLEQIEDSLRTKAILVREAVRKRPDGPEPLLQNRIKALRQEIDTRITLLAEDGRVLADSEQDPEQMENHADRPEVRAARDHRFGASTRFSTTLSEPMMYVALPASADAGTVAYVRVALPLDKVQEQLTGLHHLVWSAAIITAMAVLLLALWLARRITLPLQELRAGAERVALGDYGHKVYVAGRDEIATLARTFNHMSERLASQFAQLAEDRQQLRMILGGMVEGVVALDAEQHILFTNERATELLGLKLQPTAGRKLWEVVRRRSLQDVVRRALAEPGPYQAELSWNGPEAKNLTVHAARLPGSPPRGAVLVLHDTSELRKLERLRQDFVANVSHELKTPLAVIKACVETLLEGAVDDPENRGAFLQNVAEQADRLHALILDLLSLARVESGTEAFDFHAVPLGPVVEACVERHRARAEAKSQVLEAVPPVDESAVGGQRPGLGDLEEIDSQVLTAVQAWADEEAVHQILDNLVDNALKYTPAGGRIQVRWRALDGQVCLEVEDTGIGIPEQDLPRVFERFYRVDKARARELGGTGLGLAIVKHLAQAMHGNVHATSRPGQGTTFSVQLRRATEQVSPRSATTGTG
jgi:two-component system phosphate regulon sensor histidine kinase PhoR